MEISEKLREGEQPQLQQAEELSGSYREAVDELEHLMHSLDNLFSNFAPNLSPFKNGAESPVKNGGKLGSLPVFQGEPGKVMRIVAEINKILAESDTKETKI